MGTNETSSKQDFETTRFHHFPFAGGNVTVAYQVDQNKGAEKRTVRFACAFTSPRDTFSRAKGRQISSGRLECFAGKVQRERLMAKQIEITVPAEKPLSVVLDTVRKEAARLAQKRCPWAKSV